MIAIFIMIPIAFIFLALVVDVNLLTLAHAETQMTADASAIAGTVYGATAVKNPKKSVWEPVVDRYGNITGDRVNGTSGASGSAVSNFGGKSADTMAKNVFNQNVKNMNNNSKYYINKGKPDLHLQGKYIVDVETQHQTRIIGSILAFFGQSHNGNITIKKTAEMKVNIK